MTGSADNPRIKVLEAGLAQFGAHCQAAGGELMSTGAVPAVAVSSWQATAAVVDIANAGSGKDVAAMTARMDSSSAKFAAAGAAYATTEAAAAAALTGLVR